MVELEFIPRDGGSTLTVPDTDIQSLNATLTNTGVGTFRATIQGDRAIEDRAKVQDRVNVNTNNTKFAGYITTVSQQRATGDTQIRGKGIAKKLQEGRPDYQSNGGPIVYDDVFAGEAIEDYWSRTPFGNVPVTKQQSNVVVQDSLTQSADTQTEWENIVSIPDTTPAFVDNGKLKHAQTNHVTEVEDTNNGGQSTTDVNYSDGEAILDLNQTDGLFIQFDFTINYDVPANDWEVAVRGETDSNDGLGNTYQAKVDGANVGLTNTFSDTSLEWITAEGGFELTEGSHTLTIEIVSINDDQIIFDVLGLLDKRFTYTLDNTVDSDNGHLDGPALYPTDANPVVRTNPTTTTRNIDVAEVTATINDTSNDQRLGLSNNSGTDYELEKRVERR